MTNTTNTFFYYNRDGMVYSTSYDHVFQYSKLVGVMQMRICWLAVDMTTMPFFFSNFVVASTARNVFLIL